MPEKSPARQIFQRFIQFVYAYMPFVAILAVGALFLWVNDNIIYKISDRLAIFVYPLALFFIYLLYLIGRLVMLIIKARKTPPQ